MTTENLKSNQISETKKSQKSNIDNDTMKLLKGIGHQIKPVVMIGSNGLTENILEEIERALTDHELIKIKLPAGSKEERKGYADEIISKTGAELIQNVGRMALLLRKNPTALPRLSNLVRYTC